MASSSNYALRLPASLMSDVRVAAERDGVSINAFLVQAAAEKIAVLRARGMLDDVDAGTQADYLEARAARSAPGRFAALLAKAGTETTVRPGDEMPPDWEAETGGG